MAIGVKASLETRQLVLPESMTLRRSIQSVKRFIGATGSIRFDAARSDAGAGGGSCGLWLWRMRRLGFGGYCAGFGVRAGWQVGDGRSDGEGFLMIEVCLLTVDHRQVALCLMPSFEWPPQVVTFGSRTFVVADMDHRG